MITYKSGWKQVKLKELCREITVGYVGPMATEYSDSGIPFLRSQNILPFHLDLSSIKFISPQFHKKIKKSALFPGDVVVVRTGYPGTACVIPRNLPIANCADLVIFRPSDRLDSHYLTYIFNSAWGRSHVLGNLVGVAQQHFNVTVAKEMVINLPSLPIQRKIAAILSAYDDLIEINTRRIAILEEMAQSLYREWFVHFRFPGHEKKRMVESALGMIPEGWEVVNFTQIIDVLSGGTPRTAINKYWNGEIPFFTPKDAQSSFYVTTTERSITESGLKACSSRLYPKNTVFITARGTVGKVVLNSGDMAMSQSSYALRGQDGLDQLFTFLLTRNCIDQLKQNSHGAVFDTIIINTFTRLKVIKPPIALTRKLSSIVEPIFGEVLNLLYKNANLRQARDLLLPELISGKIDVERLEIGGIEDTEELETKAIQV